LIDPKTYIIPCCPKDLYIDCPFLIARRGVHDVVHKVVAVGSRSIEKAQKFINDFAGGDPSIKAYGSYDEVYADKVCRSIVTFGHGSLRKLRVSTLYTLVSVHEPPANTF
jgi:hypothetical protein